MYIDNTSATPKFVFYTVITSSCLFTTHMCDFFSILTIVPLVIENVDLRGITDPSDWQYKGIC